jgi:hypothetical protein
MKYKRLRNQRKNPRKEEEKKKESKEGRRKNQPRSRNPYILTNPNI